MEQDKRHANRGEENKGIEQSETLYTCHMCEKEICKTEGHRAVSIHENQQPTHDDGTVELLRCPHCQKDVAISHKHYWINIEDFLHGTQVFTGVKQVMTGQDRRTLYLLGQVCYNQYDCDRATGHSPFLKFSSKEVARLLWVDGEAVGFYTVKESGTRVYEDGLERYKMPVCDTIYVRAKFQRQGLGTMLARDFCSLYQGQQVGFSSPVSNSLYKVLYKMMLRDSTLRDRLWECEFDASEGYCCNLWFHLSLVARQKRKTCAQAQGAQHGASSQGKKRPEIQKDRI